MASQTSIINSARRKLGANRIIDPSQVPEFQEAYDDLRPALLRRYTWPFAKARLKLARNTTAPPFGWDFSYALPADWFRNVSVHDNDRGRGRIRFKVEGRDILTDAINVYLVYIRDITDANQMTPDFRETLAWLIAWELAIRVTDSRSMSDDMKRGFNKSTRIARSTGAIESQPREFPDGSWVTCR